MAKICGCPFPCDGDVAFNGGCQMAACTKCGASVYDTTHEGRLEIIDELISSGVATMEVAQVVDYENRKRCPSCPGGAVIFGVRKMTLQQ